MQSITPTSEQVHLAPRSNSALIGKALLVAVVVAGLAAATFFSGGAALALIAAGAASWKIGLVIVGCIGSAIALGGSVYFAAKDNMFEDTGHNLKDSGKFLVHTLGSGAYVAAQGIDCVRDIEIWNLIISR